MRVRLGDGVYFEPRRRRLITPTLNQAPTSITERIKREMLVYRSIERSNAHVVLDPILGGDDVQRAAYAEAVTLYAGTGLLPVILVAADAIECEMVMAGGGRVDQLSIQKTLDCAADVASLILRLAGVQEHGPRDWRIGRGGVYFQLTPDIMHEALQNLCG